MTWPRVALLDRDGVLNENRPDHVTDLRDWSWLPRAIEGCARLAGAGVRIAVVTNQAAVARGQLSETGLARIHAHMVRGLAAAGVPEPLVLHCPHAPDAECRCRKPRPGMLVDAIARLRVHAGDCVLVGDHMHDLHAAESAGCWSVHVRSGRGGLPDDPPLGCLGSVPDLADAADLALSPRRRPLRVPGDRAD